MDGLRIRVRGQVQGVGFRPFVWSLCTGMGLVGRVLNDPRGVLIYAAGPGVAQLPDRLRAEAPPLARVESVEVSAAQVTGPGFTIAPSQGQGSQTQIAPDAATCPDCLAELRDPGDRRYGYGFANCTNCGPRFSIINGMPYDRSQTTMADFPLCALCAAEYDDPADRRFHAQPVACANCGPKLWLHGFDGAPIAEAARRLRAGDVLAIKGLGGFHLACDALNPDAVARLRARKQRPEKPFALMGTLNMIGPVSEPERARLTDPAAPVVLIPGTPPTGVAPGQGTVGWMLPYTPVHHLLMDAFGGPLVMTSGNLSGEPQVIGTDEALAKLSGFADGFLMHDRDIARRLDDSVERADPPMVIRRARGRVPGVLALPPGVEGAPAITAYGGQMKAAICLFKGDQAMLGHHLGDLDGALCFDAFLQADRDYAAIVDHEPALVACDLHPDFAASRHAHGLGLPVVEVQHHHAHMAACMGENGWPVGAPVAGIVLDGLGLGTDGALWGGELLVGDYHSVERRAWLEPAALPGGDMAQREPWRNLLARASGPQVDALLAGKPVDMVRAAMARGVNCPMSSSAGRLFDAVAALVFRDTGAQSYEGAFAMRLEAAAMRAGEAPDLPLPGGAGPLAVAPMMGALVKMSGRVPPEAMALAFHRWLAQTVAGAARAVVEAGEAEAVALSGGCFQNALLHRLVVQALGDVPVLVHRTVPAGDGGLAFGQGLVAGVRAKNG